MVSSLSWISFAVVVLQMIGYGISMSESESLRASKKALMKSLGLKHLPQIAPIQSDFFLRRYSAPRFMMGLFNEVSGELRYSSSHGFHVNTSHAQYEIERKYLDDSEVDTVISFIKYDDDKSWDHVQQDFKIKFKTNFDLQKMIVQGGELKIYKRLPRNDHVAHANCTVSVYLILPKGKTPELLDTRDVHAWSAGWHTFNVTAALKLWAVFPLRNHGLRIVVHHAHEDLSPRSFGIVGTRGSLDKRPYLVGFVTTTGVLPMFTPERVTSRERRASKDRRRTRANPRKECKRKSFIVDFKQIGLHRTIIAPDTYNMYFCEGHCEYPIDKSLDGTNHAALQGMLNIITVGKIPNPCCVPGELKSKSLLFYDSKGNVLMKKHPEMIASSCVCH